jgi:hypothetical protein
MAAFRDFGRQGAIMTTRAFDIGTAIFFFFKRFGENPGGAIRIGVSQIVLCGLIGVAALYLLMPVWTSLVELIVLDEAGQLTEEVAVRHVFSILGSSLFLIMLSVPVGIALALMFQAAWLRFLAKGEVKPGLPFRLGGDEVRLLGVNLLYIAMAVALYIAIAIVMVIAGLGAALVVKGGGDSLGVGIGAGLLVAVAALAIAVAVLVVAVRLASAPALTIVEGRLRFFESWEATKGVFWHMLVSYIAVWALVMVLSSIVGFVVQIFLLGAMLPALMELVALEEAGTIVEPQMVFDALGSAFGNPFSIAALVVGFVLAYAMQLTLEGMWHGVGAYNAARVSGSGEGRDLDAPVLDKDHPMGASPGEG